MGKFGYAGKILRVDLSNNDLTDLPTSNYSRRFIGGKGFAAKIFWDETTQHTKALDPNNFLLIMTGPVTGFTGLAGSRWTICGKSPEVEPEAFSYSNFGGSWGVWLKYAGYDGIAITGKADKPVFILIDKGKVQIQDASHLWGKNGLETQEIICGQLGSKTRVMAIGQAGEKQVTFATILATDNAVGSSGFGAVMGSKMLKAIAIRVDEKIFPTAFDPEKLKTLIQDVHRIKGTNRELFHAAGLPPENDLTRFTKCYGCIDECIRSAYKWEDGKEYKFFCQASNVYHAAAQRYGSGVDVSMMATRLCDLYGLDTAVVEPMISWLGECYSAGVLTEEHTGLPLSKIGSADFFDKLVRMISFREGFGDILALGTLRAAGIVGKDSHKLINMKIGTGVGTRASEGRDYDPRLIPINILSYATEPRRPIQVLHGAAIPFVRWIVHSNDSSESFFSYEVFMQIAEEFWGSSEAADFSTLSGKALATKNIQDYNNIKECMILCDLQWPHYHIKSIDKNIRFSTMESLILSAITGMEITEEKYNLIGERIFNLQRAIHINQGWKGRKADTLIDYYHDDPLHWALFADECMVPGPNGVLTSKKGSVVDRGEFETLKDEYYRLRGWDIETGLQTQGRLEMLELNDVAKDLKQRKLVL